MTKNRQSNRLKDYDYSSEGMYFVAICTYERWCLFGDINEGKMVSNDAGRAAEQCWNEIPTPRPCGTSKTIGSMIRGFKTGVTKYVRQNTDRHVVWQRNYYDHIIRNENDLTRIREYIMNNPAKWDEDENNPLKTPKDTSLV